MLIGEKITLRFTSKGNNNTNTKKSPPMVSGS